MGALYKLAKNYTLEIAAVVLALSVVGLLVSFGGLAYLSAPLHAQYVLAVQEWNLWIMFLAVMGLIAGGWYVGEQLWNRRKFERLIATDKRSDFSSARKDLEDLARRLPDAYRPRIAEKEAAFKSRR